MLSIVNTIALNGTEGTIVEAQVDLSAGIPHWDMVGMLGTSIKESKERITVAIKNTGIKLVGKKISVNLAPAEIRKEGSSFDLAIAVGILINLGIIKKECINSAVFIGEISYSGKINSVKGAWENLLVGITNPDADWDKLIQNLVDTVTAAGENILPAVGSALVGVSALIRDLFPMIAQEIPTLISEILPQLVDTGISVVNSLITGIQQNLPALMEGAIQIVTSIGNAIITMLPQILTIAMQLIQTLINGIIIMLPQIIQMGMQLITQLILGIAQMLPQLIPQAVNAIITIVNGLLDNIDMLVDAAIQLILGLADGLINALPILIEKAPEIIMKLVTALIKNAPKILEAGVQLIVKLVEGVGSVLGKLGQMAGTIIQTIWDGLKSLPSKMLEVGKNLIQGIWNGISNAVGWLWDKISGFCSGIVDKIKGFFGIHSPSKVFADEVGKFLALGLGEGFDDNLGKVYKNMQSAVDFETQKLSANLSTTATNNKLFTANILMKPSDIYLDSTKVGRAVTPAVTKTLRGAGAY